MNAISQNNELKAYAVALILSDNAEQRNRILRMNHTQFSLFKRTNTHCDNDSTSNGNCQTKMSWLSETNGGALVKPAKSPFHEKRLKYRKKSNPENPQAGTSYFANCDRDESGHCLPKGESEGDSSDSSEATEIKKHEGKIKKIGSTIASIFANASTTVYTHLTDILDTAEEHARSQMTKHSDAIQHELGVSANTAMLIVSHAFAYVHTKLKKKLNGKDLDYTEIAEYVIKVLEAVYSDLGVTTFPLPTIDEVKHMLSLKHTPNAKLLKKSILDYRKKSTEPSNTQAGESYFATCKRDKQGHCLPKGEQDDQSTDDEEYELDLSGLDDDIADPSNDDEEYELDLSDLEDDISDSKPSSDDEEEITIEDDPDDEEYELDLSDLDDDQIPSYAPPEDDEDYGLDLSDMEDDDTSSNMPMQNKPNQDNEAKAKEVVEKHSAEVIRQLTPDQLESVKYYTSSGYFDMNGSMRKCPPTFDCVPDYLKEKLENIQSALDRAGKLPEPIPVSRGMRIYDESLKKAMINLIENLQASGGDFQFPSFTSTTIKQNVADMFGDTDDRAIQFKITAKTGLYVESITENPNEYELLQSPKSKYKIQRVEVTKNGAHIVHMEEVGDEDNQKSLFVYLKKSQPTNPQAGDSYFGNCERDKQGHCLPKGESEGESQEEAPAKDYKEASERAISQLSKEGKNAIYYYTSTGHGTINSEMRKCPPKFECVDKDILKKANAIRTAIEVAGKFPKPVDVSRGLYITDPVIREALVKQLESIHANDGYFQWPSLASTSTNSNTANEFGSSGAFGIMFQIKAKSGLYVESVTANTGENEIIQSWKTRYKIKNIEMTPKGGRVVHMEEI